METSVLDPNIARKSFRVGYLLYYATEVGFQEPFDRDALKARLNFLIANALVLAKQVKLDVFNATTIMDNTLFLQEQKFVAGDGQLYYYISNYNINPVTGGTDGNGQPDVDKLSGLGVTML